jgi:hypothetical protein
MHRLSVMHHRPYKLQLILRCRRALLAANTMLFEFKQAGVSIVAWKM